MSIIKGTNQIVAGFGGTKRSLGEVYFSQSSLATDNSGALPLFTGETIASASTLYPEFYAWVLAHPELQVTADGYESALGSFGECPQYVIGDGSLRLPKKAQEGVLYPWVVAYAAAIPASTAQAAEFQQGLSGKADIGLGNITAEAKKLIAHLGSPSDRHVNIPLGASNTEYTAPADGYFCLNGKPGISANFSFSLHNTTTGIMSTNRGNTYADWVSSFIPVKKGDVVHLLYNNVTSASHSFVFTYAEGAE